MPSNHKRYILATLGVVALAFGIRLGLTAAFVGLGSPPDAQANPDQLEFEAIAWQVAQGHGFSLETGEPTGRRALGAVATMVPPYLAAGRSYAAGRLWLVLLSALTCGLCVWIGALSFGRIAGLLAGLGLALYPGHAYYALHFVSETPFTFWLALAVALSLHGLRANWRWRHTLAGAAWAMAVLAKPQFVLMIPLMLAFIGVYSLAGLRRDAVAWWRMPAIVTCLTAAACIAPWIVRNHTVMGTPGLSTIVGHTLWGSNNEVVLNDPVWCGRWVRTSDLERQLGLPLPEGEAAANRAATAYAVAFAKSHRHELPGMAAKKLHRLITPWPVTDNQPVRWAEGLAWCCVGPLAAVGLLLGWRQHRVAICVLLTPVLVTLGVTVVFYGSVRFRNALAPVLLVLSAGGLVRLVALFRQPGREPTPAANRRQSRAPA